MRGLCLWVVLAVCVALPAGAQSGGKTAIEGVIQGQMDAFAKDDVAEAFRFASPNIKRIFGSSENFGMMVQQGYPMVWKPANIRYLDLREIDGQMWQKVMVTDAAGAIHILDYAMTEVGGVWQIDGVQLLQAPQVGA
jgi:hypothetical protein